MLDFLRVIRKNRIPAEGSTKPLRCQLLFCVCGVTTTLLPKRYVYSVYRETLEGTCYFERELLYVYELASKIFFPVKT
jgi:hypothetical protein